MKENRVDDYQRDRQILKETKNPESCFIEKREIGIVEEVKKIKFSGTKTEVVQKYNHQWNHGQFFVRILFHKQMRSYSVTKEKGSCCK